MFSFSLHKEILYLLCCKHIHNRKANSVKMSGEKRSSSFFPIDIGQVIHQRDNNSETVLETSVSLFFLSIYTNRFFCVLYSLSYFVGAIQDIVESGRIIYFYGKRGTVWSILEKKHK